MSGDMYEVAFRGEIADGADAEQVKAAVGKMFKADAAKLAHLFSGKRVVIKKNIDQQTAMKYQSALQKAGAVCEIKNLSEPEAAPAAVEQPVETEQPSAAPAETRAREIPENIPPAPDTDPLHITGDQINELSATIAPPGSDVQDEIKEVAEPELDVSAFSMAPVGSDIGDKKEEAAPPPPNTDGMSIVDD